MTIESHIRPLLAAELEDFAPKPATVDAVVRLLGGHIRRARAAALVLVPATVLVIAIAYIVLKRDVRIEFSAAIIAAALAVYGYYKPEMTQLSEDEILAAWMRTEPRALTAPKLTAIARIATSRTAPFDRMLPAIGAALMFLVSLAKALDWY